MELRWLRGDCHLHTTNSDGKKTPEQLYEALHLRKMDFAFITDHNKNTVGDKAFFYKGMGVFPGMEISGSQGHVNVFCENMGFSGIERFQTAEQYFELIEELRKKGAFVSVNHPMDRVIPWRIGFEDFRTDSVEVWNSPMHTDDVYCLQWWHELLLNGTFIPAVGGSDFHRDYLVTNLLASPTTYVAARSNGMEDVLAGIRAGHVFVTNSPNAARLFLTSGEAIPGDAVAFSDGAFVHVACDFLRKGQTLNVYNNDKLLLRHRAKKREENVSFDLPVHEKGFVRAEVRYQLKGAAAGLYKFGAGKLRQHGKDEPVPPFVYSFTNPIFFR